MGAGANFFRKLQKNKKEEKKDLVHRPSSSSLSSRATPGPDAAAGRGKLTVVGWEGAHAAPLWGYPSPPGGDSQGREDEEGEEEEDEEEERKRGR